MACIAGHLLDGAQFTLYCRPPGCRNTVLQIGIVCQAAAMLGTVLILNGVIEAVGIRRDAAKILSWETPGYESYQGYPWVPAAGSASCRARWCQCRNAVTDQSWLLRRCRCMAVLPTGGGGGKTADGMAIIAKKFIAAIRRFRIKLAARLVGYD